MNASTTVAKLPRGAVDCHVHVFDPARFPFARDAAYHPVAAEWGSAADLAATLDAAGVERVVLVNPTSGYGEDNACMLDALERLGERARGIARVPLGASSRALDALARRGVVGVRIDVVTAGVELVRDREFARFADRLADRDLVLDVQAQAGQWSVVAPALAQTRVRVVVDHAGRPQPDDGVSAPAFRALLGLARTGRVAVKLSGPMRYSRRAPPYTDASPFVAAILREFTPERLVWGSDWPFLRPERRLDYGPMLAWFLESVPAPAARTILATTPRRWFGFDDPGR